MKKVFAVIFESETMLLNESGNIAEHFKNTDNSKEYCGCWGETQSNRAECLNAIASTVNHFIKSPHKNEIIFGCSDKDIAEIRPLLLIDDCEIIEFNYNDFINSYTF